MWSQPTQSGTSWPLIPHGSSPRAVYLHSPNRVACASAEPTDLRHLRASVVPGLAPMSGIGSIPGAAGGNPVVFFDISIGGHSAGRIKMEVCVLHASRLPAGHTTSADAPARKHSAVHRDDRTHARLCARSSFRMLSHALRITSGAHGRNRGVGAPLTERGVRCVHRQLCTGEFRWASDARAPSLLPHLTLSPHFRASFCARQEGW